MGQLIEVSTNKFNKSIIFELNRSVSGQEGMTFHNISQASLINEISGQLALELFQNLDDIESIFIQSNMVTINFLRNLGLLGADVEIPA
jgi:uncharacterized FlaG/YvyC family protein